ncbi:MAG: hypothetical protein KKG47_03705, partial [Proteobacteria bacterium]|nr:hypothetical protein [Pseudomonadota bacterium]MBU1739510.1 hypothetical protein [Pseudomonadota bacterium]
YDDIETDGYHIFSRTSARTSGFYPNRFPDYPGATLSELSVGDRITIRAFFPVGPGKPPRVDSGCIDLKIEHIDDDHLFAAILTELPKNFALSTGDSLEIWEDEILYS